MEACGSAHHWARWLNGLGITVRLLPAQYVRAYVKRNKTDAADAAALLEACRASDMHPVRVKSVEQQALQGMHRIRSLWANLPVAHGLDGCSVELVGLNLAPHLRDDARLLRGEPHLPRLVDRVRERLLAIHMLAHLHRLRGGDGMAMIGNADCDGVDLVAHFVEHFAEVAERVLNLVCLNLAIERRRVDVA